MDTAPLRRLADDGDPGARLELARRMLLGKRAATDPAAAVKLLESLASSTEPRAAGFASAAKYELALCHRLGQGVKTDDARAEALLNEAAAGGDAPAVVERLERSLAAVEASSRGPGARPGEGSVGASPAQVLVTMARRGEPSAQVAAARWALRGGAGWTGVRVESGEPLGWLLKASAGDDDRAALSAVRMILEGDGPLRADRARALTLYRKLADRGLPDAHVMLAAISPESYAGLARPVSVERLFDDDRLIGSAVELAGEIREVTNDSLTLRLGDGKDIQVRRVSLPPVLADDAKKQKPAAVTLDPTAGGVDAEPSPGRLARVQGVMEASGKVAGLVVDVPTPRYQVRYDVQSPQVIRSGRTKRYVVDGEFRNVSRQRVTLATLQVRVHQPGTANDETETIQLDALQPGETRKFRVPFDLYDYRDRASGEKPRCEITVQSLRW